MVPDIVPPPPPPPMPSANYVPTKLEITIEKSEKSPSPPRNAIATSDSFDSVINEIKYKGGTLRKTKRKEVVPLEECFTTPAQNLKPVTTAKPTFKNEIIVNIVPKTNVINLKSSTDKTNNSKAIPTENSTTFKLRRPSEFLNGTKPELPANKEVLKPQLAPKISVNGTNKSTINVTAITTTKIDDRKPSMTSKVSVLTTQPPQRRPSLVSSTIRRLTSVEPPTETPFKRNQALTRSTSSGINSTIQKLERQNSEASSDGTTKKIQDSPTETPFKRNQSLTRSTNAGFSSTVQKLERQNSEASSDGTTKKIQDSPTETPFKRNQSLTRSTNGGIGSTVQKLERQNSEASSDGTTKKIQDSPTETPFKRNQSLTRSTNGGIGSTVQKLERQNSETSSDGTTKNFQRSNSVRQWINQMNKVDNEKPLQIKDGIQIWIGRRPIMVPRPNLPRPSNGTMKLLNELNNPSIARATHHQNGNDIIKLDNEQARVGTTVNVADLSGTVTAGDPNVKKLVYNTYRNLLGAYNNKANVVVSNQNDTMVVQDRGVTEQQTKITGPPQGNMPSQRPRSEIHANPVPPACVQNAMMTKDKKPFTYTPGGIDLSEIRSPRMAKRIERNAQAPGVGEVPKSPNTYHPSGPLPPSALAAMQTNMPIQVFPSGAAPPPPPPPPTQQQASGRSIPPPPPPPPPQGPLPTKPVSTNEGILDRPDMTRIIPENPMAMLRKTPKTERKPFLDELNDLERQQSRPTPQQYQQTPPIRQNNVTSHQYQNPNQNQVPQTPQFVPQTQQYSPQVQQYQVQSPPIVPYNNSAPSGSNQQRSQVGALYIPPVTTSNGNNNSYEATSPPTPPIRNPPSPQSPQAQLIKAPRPWQVQKREDDKPTWAHKEEKVSTPQDEYIAPPQEQPEPPRRQHSYNQAEFYSPQYQRPQMAMYDPNVVSKEPPAAGGGVQVVWVTQPQVLVHPGIVPQQQQMSPQPQQQQQKTRQQNQQPMDGQGARIIPIQVEREQPQTPERNFNRQQSWGAPTQSNSFKVLQKMTSTDGEFEDDSPATEHPPRTSQEFNQTPADQIRKLKMSQDDRELVHKFKQDEDAYLHHEVDPRYRGPNIPSKAFRLLQSMTDSLPEDYPPPPPNVPKGQQPSTPYVRNIPIQIEGDDSAGQYVHPSQQSVPEPKKYTGGNIPGRSFKMLQSMTGQTSPLATNNANYQTHQPYNPYNIHPPPPPYYWPNYYHPDQSNAHSDHKTTQESSPNICSSCRNASVPFWNHYYPMPYHPNPETGEESEHLNYQLMWNPFYYYYYYQPVQTHLPKNLNRRSDFELNCNAQKNIKRQSCADSDDWSSSNEEIAYYTNDVQSDMLAGRILKSKTPAGAASMDSEEDEDSTDSEEESAQSKVVRDQRSGSLQSVKSVKDMNTLKIEAQDCKTKVHSLIDEEINNNETSKDYNVEEASSTDETSLIAIEERVLSVIFEESGRTSRASSVFTDDADVLEDGNSSCAVVSAKLTFTINCDNEVGNYDLEADRSTIEERQNSSDSSEIDFWSEIITEEEIVPKPNRLEKYKNALRDVANKTTEENQNFSNSNFECNKKNSSQLNDDTNNLKKRTIDNANPTCHCFNKTSPVEDEIVVVEGEDYKLSNLVFERQKDREILIAPNLELCNKSNDLKKWETKELLVKDQSNEFNNFEAPSVESTFKNDGAIEDHVEINEDKAKTCVETYTLEVPCSSDSSNRSSLSRSGGSTSGKEYVKGYSDQNDQNNTEEVLFEVPSIKDRIKSLQQAICKPIKKIIATMEVPNGTNRLPTIIQACEHESIDHNEDDGDSGVTSDMSRPDSESELSYQRAATHSRLYQLLHNTSCSAEEDATKKCDEEDMMRRRQHLTLPLKKDVEQSGLNSPQTTDKLACDLLLSLLQQKKGQIFRNMPMEKLHAAALKILQDLGGSEEFLSPFRTDTESSTPAQTPAEFYSDYYASWQNYDEQSNFVVPPECPRVPIVPQSVSKVPPDHVPS